MTKNAGACDARCNLCKEHVTQMHGHVFFCFLDAHCVRQVYACAGEIGEEVVGSEIVALYHLL